MPDVSDSRATNGSTHAQAERKVGRFSLRDLVEETPGCQIWRAEDNTLQREVALWLIDADDDLSADLEASTRTAATVDDRRALRILDVFKADGRVAVVTEWVEGEVLRDHLREPLPAAEAARITYEVAGALESAHAAGIVHGRLRPSNVLISDNGEVRLTGLGIDAVVNGVEPAAANDPIAADLHGVGAILYAGLTARWPGEEVDGIPASPDIAGRTPPPSNLVAEVPESLDDICASTVLSIDRPRGREPFTSVGQVREHLGSSLTDLTGERRRFLGEQAKSASPIIGRVLVALGTALLVLGLAWGGLKLLRGPGDEVPDQAAATPTAAAPKPTKAPEAKPTTYTIVGGQDFDPLGNGEENPGRVPYAYDGDLNTAWRTVTYYNKSLDKPGVGILFDLGSPKAIGEVKLDLVGNGTDLQVLTSNEIGTSPQDFELMAQATEAGESVTLKAPRPPSARYVLVWMTGLPQVDGGWRGGIREIEITS